jgi:phage/plasmid-like protein (TIGR03299 family)
MPAVVETMAYKNEVPWHGLGNKIDFDATPDQMLDAAGLRWGVHKVPMGILVKASEDAPFEWTGRVVPNRFALQRDTDNKVLAVVGSKYQPVQNEEAFEFFKRFTEAGHMKMETAGSLQDGKFVWGLARIDQTFKVGGPKSKDEIENFLLLVSPFKESRSLMAMYTSVRVVCWNTLSAALGQNLVAGKKQAQEGRQVFRMPHSMKFNDETKAKAELALGLATEQIVEFKAITNLLAKTRLAPAAATEFFFKVMRLDDDKVAALQDKEDPAKTPILLAKFEEALQFAPGHAMGSAEGTYWGALNAVTYVVDHEIGRTRDTGLYRAWLGSGARMKQRALNLAVADAKAAA